MRKQRASRYNVELLRATRDKVLFEPEAHDQSSWARFRRKAPFKGKPPIVAEGSVRYYAASCPSTACVAGWATILSGAQLCVEAGPVDWALGSRGARIAATVSKCVRSDNGEIQDIMAYATEALGLTHLEAKALFEGHNGREQVLGMLDNLIKAGESIH